MEMNWIPVSERLPERFETVLAAYVGRYGRSITKTLSKVICEIDSVIAWMSLPEPYIRM